MASIRFVPMAERYETAHPLRVMQCRQAAANTPGS
jgi:hypothetical protein